MAKVKKVVDNNGEVKLEPMKRSKVRLRIVGISPLIQHQWSQKAITMMKEKQAGKKTKNRAVRDPEKECEDATYRTVDGEYGVPAMAIKSAICSAAHKDIGVEKTLVKKALFIECKDAGMVVPMDCDEPEMGEDMVRVGMGSADIRYRPYFHRWAVDMEWELATDYLQVGDLVNLIDRAGFGIGIGEWRPEKGGEYGRFRVDRTAPIQEMKIDD